MENDLIQVVIIAPTFAVRVGLRTLLSEDQSINIVAEAASFEDGTDTIMDIPLDFRKRTFAPRRVSVE